ncbi:tetratricopeptide repeat protein [Parerythrobacter lacustris]|uniref:Tetratricopeptide repeat protein n=1 Tax=Parerythrobacter lacustris TaxID=2969984 RepID=A0ABT1XPN1_9SPHN|nr:tetratricopeptide repeat protein [Parerythrobacter lacustris]MCR2832427.1 tetratricopeptide repeat protein [Parerythrobacter lacustris]
MPISFILAMLLQVGPNPSPDSVANTIPRSPREEAIDPVRAPEPQAVAPACPLGGETEPSEVARIAARNAELLDGRDRIGALHCLALAQGEQGLWDEAAAGFLIAREAAVGMPDWQARLGSQRAHALVEARRITEARTAFELAIEDALAAGDPVTAGQIAADQAIVEVGAGDVPSASRTLEAARERTPQSAQVWLLSATLARRQGALEQAQGFVERAADIDAFDPEIGLEAGVIAVLSGRYSAAKASFESVIALPNAGAHGETAKGYLAQLEQLDQPTE